MIVIKLINPTHIVEGSRHHNILVESKNKVLSYGARKLSLHARMFSHDSVWIQLAMFSLA